MFGSQIHALLDANIYLKKHKIESAIYAFSIPSLRAPTAIIQQLIAILRLVIRYNIGWAGPRLVSKKCGKKGCTLEVINKLKLTQSLPNFVRTCTNMWGTIPYLILDILWNGVKWRRMTSHGKTTWNYWKTGEVSKKNHVDLC